MRPGSSWIVTGPGNTVRYLPSTTMLIAAPLASLRRSRPKTGLFADGAVSGCSLVTNRKSSHKAKTSTLCGADPPFDTGPVAKHRPRDLKGAFRVRTTRLCVGAGSGRCDRDTGCHLRRALPRSRRRLRALARISSLLRASRTCSCDRRCAHPGAAGLAVLATLGVGSSCWHVLGGFALAGAGMALSAAPATNGIVASLPQGKQGVASAVNDIERFTGRTRTD